MESKRTGGEDVDNPRREALGILADTPALLIFDNLESLDDGEIDGLTSRIVNDLPAHTTKVVFTTRHVAIREGSVLRLGKLSMRDASALIEDELRVRRLTLSDADKDRLLARTGRIPLAIKYVIGRFELVHDIPQLIHTADQDEALLEFIFRETFGILSADERRILFAAAFEESSSVRTLQAATGLPAPALERALYKLKSVSFLDSGANSGSYSMSPLTAAFARQELANDLDLNLEL